MRRIVKNELIDELGNWTRGKRALFKHRYVIKVIAFDNAGNSNFTNIKVKRFF